MSLFDHKIIVVTGKGGVGKTTVCAALGLLAAERGLRTLITETSGARILPGIFGTRSRGYLPVALAPRLETLSITPLEAIEDYVIQQIKVRKLYELVFRNRVMSTFVDAVPGLHDAVQLGKVWDCAVQMRGPDGRPRWDLVIVDAPATGHGLTMLQAPRSMMELTRAGPMYRANANVDRDISDPARTRIVLVSLPEEMPVAETLDLHRRLGDRRRQLSFCVLNEVHPRPTITGEEWTQARPALRQPQDPAIDEVVGFVDRWMDRVAFQDDARERLRRGLEIPVVDLPYMVHRDLSPADLESLAHHLVPTVEAA